jgi:hypothetical protein
MSHDAPRPLVAAALALLGLLARVGAQDEFRRGHLGHSGALRTSDALGILSHLFQEGRPLPLSCADAADADDNGKVEIADALVVLNSVHCLGPAPREPFLFCGPDPTPDGLDCVQSFHCPTGSSLLEGARALWAEGLIVAIERSETMQDTGQLAVAKRELACALESLSARPPIPLAIIFFDEEVVTYPLPGDVVRSSCSVVSQALKFVEEMPGGRGACPVAAIDAALDFAREFPPGTRSVLIAVSTRIGLVAFLEVTAADELDSVLERLRISPFDC